MVRRSTTTIRADAWTIVFRGSGSSGDDNLRGKVDAALLQIKYFLSFYVGGMGAKSTNFHKNLFIRMGDEKEADEIQNLFFEDKRDEAARVIPDELADSLSLVGSVDRIRDRLLWVAWR